MVGERKDPVLQSRWEAHRGWGEVPETGGMTVTALFCLHFSPTLLPLAPPPALQQSVFLPANTGEFWELFEHFLQSLRQDENPTPEPCTTPASTFTQTTQETDKICWSVMLLIPESRLQASPFSSRNFTFLVQQRYSPEGKLPC